MSSVSFTTSYNLTVICPSTIPLFLLYFPVSSSSICNFTLFPLFTCQCKKQSLSHLPFSTLSYDFCFSGSSEKVVGHPICLHSTYYGRAFG